MYEAGYIWTEIRNGEVIKHALTAKEAKELNKAIEVAEAEQEED